LTVDLKAALKALRVQDAMSSPVLTIGPDESIQDAAATLLEHRVGSLPVIEEGRLVGIVTTSDLLRAVARSAPALERVQLGV
jgi:CBS domain-containing protein